MHVKLEMVTHVRIKDFLFLIVHCSTFILLDLIHKDEV